MFLFICDGRFGRRPIQGIFHVYLELSTTTATRCRDFIKLWHRIFIYETVIFVYVSYCIVSRVTWLRLSICILWYYSISNLIYNINGIRYDYVYTYRRQRYVVFGAAFSLAALTLQSMTKHLWTSSCSKELLCWFPSSYLKSRI